MSETKKEKFPGDPGAKPTLLEWADAVCDLLESGYIANPSVRADKLRDRLYAQGRAAIAKEVEKATK